MKYNEKELEKVLRGYPLLKAQAAVEAEELRHLFPSCTPVYDDQPHGTGTSDQTCTFALKREAWSQNMKRARVIELACDALTVQEKDFVRLMYFEQWRRYQICLRMGLRRMQVWRVQRSALDKIAEIILA